MDSSNNMRGVSTYCWSNGKVMEREQAAPSVASVSFHLGTSVFDGMMAYWNQDHYYLHRLNEHLDRFREGAARMGLYFPWTTEEMTKGIHALLECEPKETQYIRPIAYRGGPELFVTGSDGSPADVAIFTFRTKTYRDIDEPLSCQISPIERISSRSIPGQTKVSGAYVNSFYARKTAENAGFGDALMFDRDGHVAEASAANIFFILGDKLVTPRLNPDIFPGITRQVIFELANKNGTKVEERDIRLDHLEKIEGAFLCSTFMEIRGLSRLGEHILTTLESPVFKTTVDAFRSVTHQ